ncbi:protein-disulfide reductase DsbD domain-containing protein [Gynurincola endophyticus]|jgi:hypothetical protein|uniref:protein-disulfide reductase DsbD domain-containing protein n=1 Tax=Gynurincola endophyticus TaxID=2479004 RepID=UPI000F8CE50A|nr:protein-disulfide reductase DsbD domain-containing protein [Gynurincola endophyticus]
MKKYLLFLGVLLLSVAGFAQSSKEVRWTYTATKIADKTYELKFKAVVNPPYHLYAQEVGAEGPIPTSFEFTKNPLVTVDGKVAEKGTKISKHEAVWGGKVNYYKGSVEFVQVVKLKTAAKTNVGGTITFMVCSDEHCLSPSDVTFSLAVGE